jgi:hypothetical protein
MGIVASPIQWLGGSPLLAYNILLIVSTWWSGLAAHALVRRLTASEIAAWCGGLAFAFAPYRASQLPHLHLLVTWWLPLVLLGLHAYYETGRVRWLALFGVSWLMQSLTNGYYMLFLPLLIGVWLLALTRRETLRRGAAVLGAWVVCSLPLLPVLFKYYTVQHRLGLSRSRLEMTGFSAHWHSFLDRSETLALGRGAERFTPEAILFPGLTVVLVLIAAAAIARRQFDRRSWRYFLFYVGAAMLTAWMTFGPSVDARSLDTLWHAYAWIAWLPGYSGLRVPSRFFMLTTLCLAAAAGLAAAALAARFPRYRVVIGIVIALGLLADGWIDPMPLPAPPRRFTTTLDKGAVVLELPINKEHVDIAAIYRGMLHRAPVVNGYGGYAPPHTLVVSWSLAREDASVLTELRRGHPLYVVVESGDEATQWTTFMDHQPDARMVAVSGAGRVYEMGPAAYPRQIAVGAPIKFTHASTAAEGLAIDLGAAVTVRAIDVRTDGNMRGVPDPLRVEASDDGQTWTVVAEERPGGPAFVGALADPIGIPLRVNLPDPRTRFLRINTRAFGPEAITVYGP